MLRKIWLLGSLGFFLILALPLWPQQSQVPPQLRNEQQKFGFSLAPSVGYLNGFTHEIVYPYFTSINPYLSELIWELKNIYLAGISFSLNYRNRFWLSGGFWTSLSYASGQMNDYDWFYNNITDWTHRSIHDIFLENSYIYDLRFTYNYLNWGNWAFLAGLGMQELSWDWSDAPLYYIYTSTITENSTYTTGMPLHDEEGTIDSPTGIRYKVSLFIPYLSAGLSYYFTSLSFAGSVQYSFLTQAEDHDHHILRDLHFIDVYNYIQTLGVNLQSRYFFTDHFYFELSGSYLSLFETPGRLTVYDEDWIHQSSAENAAGLSYATFSMMLASGVAF